MDGSAEPQRQKRRLLWQEIAPARGAASLTKRATFVTIETTSRQLRRSTWKTRKKTHGQARGSSNLKCRTMYTIKHQLRHNKITTSAKPAHEAGFFKRGLEAIKEMNRSKPHRRKRAERSARIEASATNGIPNTNNHKNKGANMKHKARTALIVAGLIAAMLLAGKVDNDYAEQKNTPRESCSWITTADGVSRCK